MKSKILVTGGDGQVGVEINRLLWPNEVEMDSPSHRELDITSAKNVAAYFADSRPQCVINLAAWTAVDKAESDAGAAFLVNAQGAAFLAEAARRLNVPILHVSTDYVFDGTADRPYRENDATRPLNVYGASKLAGELAVRAANPKAVVIRTAWVLSAHRSNFLKTMLKLGETNARVRVVSDQYGCPTSARDIARVLQRIALRTINDRDAPWGIYHFVNAGWTSWHGLAEYVFDHQRRLGGTRPCVDAIPSSDYPTPAARPRNSRLDTRLIGEKFGIKPRRWEQAVDDILAELAGRSEKVLR